MEKLLAPGGGGVMVEYWSVYSTLIAKLLRRHFFPGK